jgi:hypothetical protein
MELRDEKSALNGELARVTIPAISRSSIWRDSRCDKVEKLK